MPAEVVQQRAEQRKAHRRGTITRGSEKCGQQRVDHPPVAERMRDPRADKLAVGGEQQWPPVQGRVNEETGHRIRTRWRLRGAQPFRADAVERPEHPQVIDPEPAAAAEVRQPLRHPANRGSATSRLYAARAVGVLSIRQFLPVPLSLSVSNQTSAPTAGCALTHAASWSIQSALTVPPFSSAPVSAIMMGLRPP